jgi:putative aldouronate transport system permease protein
MRKSHGEGLFLTVGHIIILFCALCAVIPVILIVVSSFTDNDTLIRNGYAFFPEKWSTYAYHYVFNSGNSVVHAYSISFLLTIAGTALSIAVTTSLAYVISKKDLPGKGILVFLVFFTLLFNGGLVPSYMVYTRIFHVKNTFWGLLFPNLLMNGFNVLLMKSYFTTNVPGEILEAAYIDGSGEFRTFFQIAVPLAKPIIATIGIFSGIGYWNDWMNGYIYLTKRTDLYSIQNLLNRMIQNIQYLSQNANVVANANAGLATIPAVSVRMAMAVLGILPVVVIYPFIQNNFVKGITLGGIKG